MKTDLELYETLSKAINGLFYQTELDYPFEVFIWENTKETPIDKTEILKRTKGSPEDNIEEFDFNHLFSTPTMEQDWHTSEDKERVARFRNLVKVLKKNLTDMKVFRRGRIYIDVYITGKAPSGNIAGISTKQMQT
jgi:hypothetical protein